MKFSEFKIGDTFQCSGERYRCTDVGTRVVVAIRIDRVEVVRDRIFKETLPYEQAKKDGWFNGPPYAIAEQVFDEDDLVVCEQIWEKP